MQKPVCLLFCVLALCAVFPLSAHGSSRRVAIVPSPAGESHDKTETILLYDRMIAMVIGIDRYRDLAPEQVPSYSQKHAESVAESGPWADPNPISPWVWRDEENGGPKQKERVIAQTVYHGNVKSKVFHRPGCRYYDCKNCVVSFKSRDQALRAGYRPCKICKP